MREKLAVPNAGKGSGILSSAKCRGTCVAQSVKRVTLGLGSGHDLTVHETEPRVGLCADSVEPAWDSLSFPLSLPLPRALSLKINKLNI